MWRYILNRCLWMIFIIIGVAMLIFTILYFVPGDPAELILPEGSSREDIEQLRHALGVDRSYIEQLASFLFDTFIRFDLGESWIYKSPVVKEIGARLPRTVLMGLAGMFFSTALGIPMGISAARHQGKWQDYGVIGASMVFVSLPGFWVSLMCVILFSVKLKLLPSYGIGGLKYYILPVITGVFAGAAGMARQVRSAMLEVIRADFVTTARAKGQTEHNVVVKHMIPNAMLPIVTMLGGRFAHIVAGSSITERLFSIPGVGLYLLDGIGNRDYPIVRGCTLFFAIFSSVMILLTDLVYAWINPMIKAQYINASKKKVTK